MEAVAIDLSRRHDPDGDLRRAADDGVEELAAQRLRELLGVVQEGERANPVLAQAVEIEEHPCDDERPGERPAARLVRAGDETCAEAAIVTEELGTRAARHGPRITTSAAVSRGRGPSFPPCREGSTALRG